MGNMDVCSEINWSFIVLDVVIAQQYSGKFALFYAQILKQGKTLGSKESSELNEHTILEEAYIRWIKSTNILTCYTIKKRIYHLE